MKHENPLSQNEFIWPIRVYYEDSDAGGFVYHTNYLKFMERARTEWLRHLGFEQTQLREQYHLVFVVRKLSIDYLKPALFNDLLNVTSRLTQMGKVSITFNQQVLRDTEVLCEAVVKIAAINPIDQRIQPLPWDMLKIFRNIEEKIDNN
ncbi:4-hydroxybenzoyl-CoA thioesterase [Beggiatoa sp. PS]|nr:4-hydroxybenzoyl-CoA thioesterase [Beggiatoa sp. PS]